MNKQLPKHPISLWKDQVEFPTFPSVNEDLQVDIVIVGGGITGVTSAYLLLQEGFTVALIEADRLLSGTTGNTTAKLTAQHGLFYDELIQHFGVEKAQQYYQANTEAMEFVKSVINQYKIDCDLAIEDAYIFTQSEEEMPNLEKEYQAYEKLNIPGKMVDTCPLPFTINGALVMNNQAQFHPLKYLRFLVDEIAKKGCQIYEQTTALKVEMGEQPKVLLHNGHTITCKYVLSCSHFPFHDEGFYFARMHPERSYVVAALTEKELSGGMYINAETPTRSIRYTPYNGQNLILFSGVHHKTGQGVSTMKYFENLKTYAENAFGVKQFIYRWSAQDYSTLDKVPYIGYVTNTNRNILVATGFRKWGMTHGTLAAHISRDIILDKDNPYIELYTPSRFKTDPSVKRFLQANINVAKHLVQGKLEDPTKKIEDLKNDEGAVVKYRGKRAGAYKDESGKVIVVDTTCTHMGCEVEWNSGERTWDCPCHGSRFAINGDVVEGPAEKPLEVLSNDE